MSSMAAFNLGAAFFLLSRLSVEALPIYSGVNKAGRWNEKTMEKYEDIGLWPYFLTVH